MAQMLAAGRTLLVPSRHRAAALRQAWARARNSAGEAVWRTPEILTFDAWFAREWQRARDSGLLATPLRLLNTAQERRLWAQVLSRLPLGDGADLRIHAQALMRAAARARRTMVEPGRHAANAEERLLATALAAMDRLCAQLGCLAPGLARPQDLAGLAPVPPVWAGFAATPELATHIAGMDGAMQLPLPPVRAEVRLFGAVDARAEVQAAADWCRAQLAADPARRLLVIDRGGELPLPQVAAIFWDQLAAGTQSALGAEPDPRLLAIEGGTPLLEQGLFADALVALSLPQEPVTFQALSQLLRSPHFALLPAPVALRIERALREVPAREYGHSSLRAALAAIERRAPGAAQIDNALEALIRTLRPDEPLGAAAWAKRYDDALRALGFPGRQATDSRGAQRLARWNALLDEFATLDAIAGPLRAGDALSQLSQLARHGRHEAASEDASITLTGEGGDPVASYDGIWVMGLTATRWPEAPRPDPFVSLAAQRHAGWEEASVALRMRHARFELSAWQARTPSLVLSFASHAGDVHQLPSALLEGFAQLAEPPHAPHTETAVLLPTVDERLPALAPPHSPVALPRGVRSLELQHQCPFRAQGELRLGATALEAPEEGITARLRGDLLHAALQALWESIGDSTVLASLGAEALQRRCVAAWQAAERIVLSRQLLPPLPRALNRERARGIGLLSALLEVEAARAPFTVQGREAALDADLGGPALRLRIDRIDAFPDGTRRLVDYKSGSSAGARLEAEPPEPVQLAVYATAMLQAGQPPQAAALLTVSAQRLKLAGAGKAGTDAAAGLKVLDDWDQRLPRWSAAVASLAAGHVAGVASVAPLAGACRHCHMPRFCRIGDLAFAEEAGADDGDGEQDAAVESRDD